jgi:MoxR-like ATPase
MQLAAQIEEKPESTVDDEIQKVQKLGSEIEKIIVGQKSLICRIVVALLADGHVLLEGVPGLAKSLLVSALGAAMGGVFRRIQMVPDMLPSDLIGTYLYVGM